MPLQLKTVPAAHGLRWIRDAWKLFARRPLGFTLLFVIAFVFWALVAAVLPFVGSLVQLATVPLLSLGYMVASQSALLDGPVHPGQFIQPLRTDPARRRALLILCAVYAVAALAILMLASWISDDAMTRLQTLMLKPNPPQAEIDAILAEPGVTTGAILLVGLGVALSIPFWHAPALVHWGGQGVGQALFSSTLAVWRSRGAFIGYFVGWALLAVVFVTVAALVVTLLGSPGLAGVMALPGGLLFTAVFYVSLLFTFNDSFGGAAGPRAAEVADNP